VITTTFSPHRFNKNTMCCMSHHWWWPGAVRARASQSISQQTRWECLSFTWLLSSTLHLGGRLLRGDGRWS